MMEGSLFFVRLIRRMTTINLHEMKCAKNIIKFILISWKKNKNRTLDKFYSVLHKNKIKTE